VASRWVQSELNAALARELRDRAITVIPAVIEDCEVPPLLADRQHLDLRHDFQGGVQRLIGQLAAAPDIEFSRLDSRIFEGLVGDLLVELGFSVQPTPVTRDSGFDFIASHRSRDPFGAEKTDTWLVEVKFYREQRVSVSALRQMLGYLITSSGPSKGLVVTNSRMTSVAREFLSEISRKSGHELRVIDGTELTNLLIQHPKLVERYFARGGAQ
jgi:restriction endonuclease Mrr